MNESEPDVIDRLADIAPGSHLDAIRAQRPQARENAQKSYLALFAPEHLGGVSSQSRFALAAFVAGLHGDASANGFYQAEFAKRSDRSLAAAIEAEVRTGAAHGPYGRYPQGPLSDENRSGPTHRVSKENRAAIGARLSAALEHAHLLVFHPRDANPEDLAVPVGRGLVHDGYRDYLAADLFPVFSDPGDRGAAQLGRRDRQHTMIRSDRNE
jgi:CMD domain protein